MADSALETRPASQSETSYLLGVVEHSEIEGLLRLSQQMHAESFYRHRTLDLEKMRVVFQMAVTHPLFFLVAAYQDGWGPTIPQSERPVGMFMGQLQNYFFGPEVLAVDSLLYVLPEHRSAGVASTLIASYEAWAKSQGASDAILSTTTEIEPGKTARLFEKHGFRQIGFVHRKSLKEG